jgi:hypothetical protein
MSSHSLLYQGRVGCSFHTVLICRLGEDLDPSPSFQGQKNGMCGTAVSGRIALYVGLHTGDVHLTVKLSASSPEDISMWQEVVETPVNFREEAHLYIVNFDGDPQTKELVFPEGQWRARLSARDYENEDFAVDQPDGELQHYELVLWPADPSPDVVLKTTSEFARSVHESHWS